jgi:cell division protein FtsB
MNIDDIIENAQLKGKVIALEAQVETLTAEIRCFEAVVRAHERVDCLSVTNLQKQLTEADAENARLKAEVERLRDGVETMTYHASGVETTAWVRAVEYDRLKADIDRLTKAGDGLYKSMLEIGCNEMAENFQYDAWWGSMKDWNAAKGVQP